ncbi:MAG: PPOX class F420-dependent oxidoreductase, partial [Acidimicrobiia bacterium]|nr:PPOX class F420-dependent oxidoreductase [Acidimicrobiia bacterium]
MCFDELTGQFALLTTFRKDGTPVPTTVWFARLGDEVVVGTGHATGKVKRIGNNPDVTLERSNFRGKRKGGPVCTGAARRVGGDEAS